MKRRANQKKLSQFDEIQPETSRMGIRYQAAANAKHAIFKQYPDLFVSLNESENFGSNIVETSQSRSLTDGDLQPA